MYLSSSDAGRLLATVTRLSTPGSRFAGEYFSRPWQASDAETSDEQERAAWDLIRHAFRYGPVGTDPATWLAGHGWMPGEVTTITELGGRHGRRAPRDFARASAPRVWLFEGTLARRRAESRADPRTKAV